MPDSGAGGHDPERPAAGPARGRRRTWRRTGRRRSAWLATSLRLGLCGGPVVGPEGEPLVATRDYLMTGVVNIELGENPSGPAVPPGRARDAASSDCAADPVRRDLGRRGAQAPWTRRRVPGAPRRASDTGQQVTSHPGRRHARLTLRGELTEAPAAPGAGPDRPAPRPSRPCSASSWTCRRVVHELRRMAVLVQAQTHDRARAIELCPGAPAGGRPAAAAQRAVAPVPDGRRRRPAARPAALTGSGVAGPGGDCS